MAFWEFSGKIKDQGFVYYVSDQKVIEYESEFTLKSFLLFVLASMLRKLLL